MNRASLILPLLLPLLLVACGPKPEPRESILDSPDYHVSQGLKHLENGDLADARSEFDRALALQPDYPRALSGMGLVYAIQGDFKEALDFASEAIGEDKKDPFVWAARGRIYSLRAEPGEMDEDAEEDFEEANERDPNYDLNWFWWGKAAERAWDFDQAGRFYTKTIELRGPWADEADAAFKSIQDVLRAAPGSRVGKRIVQLDVLTRADLAVLFLEELKLAEVMERIAPTGRPPQYEPPANPTDLPRAQTGSEQVAEDIGDHWARTWIRQIVDMGVMDVAPDRKFYPDEPVTRAEFALFLQNILASVMRDPGLTTKYLSERTRFNDMRSGTVTYNAAALAVDRGFMDADLNGRFRPGDTVSGAEALLSIRSFQNHLDFDF